MTKFATWAMLLQNISLLIMVFYDFFFVILVLADYVNDQIVVLTSLLVLKIPRDRLFENM